ncbi:hypothetical protein BGZ73_000202 [Actinomortierella ambigua]|nr:hypothetical protein BGZ73_000202 [Actinomortierella ambigua]
MVSRQATAPLLANEDPRDSFDDAERELLQREEQKQIRRDRARLFLCLGLAVVLTTSAVAGTYFVARRSLSRTRNVIMMISDGFGPASQTYGRSYWQYATNRTYNTQTSLDEILVGASRTRSSDSLVTDSAAGATAFACARKTYNAAIGVDPEGIPCGTVLESAKAQGMLTGLVVTSRITHATPASFSAHVVHRDMESDIALHQIGDYPLGRQVDLMFGGGRCFFLPNTTEGSCRPDGRDLLAESQDPKYGWNKPILTRHDLNETHENGGVQLPALGLFHLDHMNFNLDRLNDKNIAAEEPSLNQMVDIALKTLKKASFKNRSGFFLMIEGSRIDMAAHNNDPAAHVHEILQYHETVQTVRNFVRENPDTVMISTSDHETGGFTLGLQPDPHTYPDYLWRPEAIARSKRSTEVLIYELLAFKGTTKERHAFVKRVVLEEGLGVTDPTEEEIAYIAAPENPPMEVLQYMGHVVSKRANLGWTTQGHTGVDVNLYAEGSEAERLRGNHENTDIGDFMVSFLDLNLDTITAKLNENLGWFKKTRQGFASVLGYASEHEKTGR